MALLKTFQQPARPKEPQKLEQLETALTDGMRDLLFEMRLIREEMKENNKKILNRISDIERAARSTRSGWYD